MPLYPNEAEILGKISVAGDVYSENSPWWIFKRLQRHTERNYPVLGPFVRGIWKDVERRMIDQRSRVERAVIQSLDEGNEAGAIELLHFFVNTCTDECIKQARCLDKLLDGMERKLPKYRDIRGDYINSLNEDVKIDFRPSEQKCYAD